MEILMVGLITVTVVFAGVLSGILLDGLKKKKVGQKDRATVLTALVLILPLLTCLATLEMMKVVGTESPGISVAVSKEK